MSNTRVKDGEDQFVDGLIYMSRTSSDWYPQILSLLNIRYGAINGVEIKGGSHEQIEVALIEKINELAVVDPHWMPRIIRYMLLTDIEMRGLSPKKRRMRL